MPNKAKTKDLYVSDISFDAEEEDLRKLFTLCGTVRSIHMITDRQSGQLKGCAYVRMATPDEAKDAINTLDGTWLVNRCIHVRAARPKNAAEPAVEPAAETRRAHRPRGRRK